LVVLVDGDFESVRGARQPRRAELLHRPKAHQRRGHHHAHRAHRAERSTSEADGADGSAGPEKLTAEDSSFAAFVAGLVWGALRLHDKVEPPGPAKDSLLRRLNLTASPGL
jgi:hypothetical protein